MTLRQVVVSAPAARADAVAECARRNDALDLSLTPDPPGPDARVVATILVTHHTRQALLDGLQSLLGAEEDWRITLLPVETTIPRVEDSVGDDEGGDDDAAGRRPYAGGLTREEIYDSVWGEAQVSGTYLVYVALSTLVACFGMIADNVAVVVGAMVIAPLLGPNLAFAVGAALGDGGLMARAAAANAAGIALALALSLGIGLVWPVDFGSTELAARTQVGFDGMAIALASGAAAALSLVTGLSSALVGVMVAVALLPPTAAIGLYLGAGAGPEAVGALLLLCVNVACVNLAAQGVMVARKITPRTWYERRGARRATRVNGAVWATLLVGLAVLLWLRSPVPM